MPSFRWLGGLAAATGILIALAAAPAQADAVWNAKARCLTYGFKNGPALARCAEAEMDFPGPKQWSFGQLDKASTACLRLGYRFGKGTDFAACKQRHLRPGLNVQY